MDTQRLARAVALLPLIAGVAGCAAVSSTSNCTLTEQFVLSPQSATLDHLGTGAQNLVQFQGLDRPTAEAGCPVPQNVQLEYASWENPDPKDIQISSALDSTNGQASCLGATGTPVTLTGTFSKVTVPASEPDQKASVTLVCK